MREFLTIEESADFVRLSESQFRTLRAEGKGPAYAKMDGRRIIFRRDDLITWVGSRMVQPARSKEPTAA
jgi:hypothetical protein